MTLDLLPTGERARITAIDWPALVEEEALRLMALGVEVGATIRIANRGVFFGQDPIALTIGRMTVALRRSHALAIAVEAL